MLILYSFVSQNRIHSSNLSLNCFGERIKVSSNTISESGRLQFKLFCDGTLYSSIPMLLACYFPYQSIYNPASSFLVHSQMCYLIHICNILFLVFIHRKTHETGMGIWWITEDTFNFYLDEFTFKRLSIRCQRMIKNIIWH